MASYLRLTEQDDAGVPTPPAGKVNIFVDDVTGEPSYKDDTGTVESLRGAQGDAGPAGAAGQGVPTGGTAGQVLAKVDGTDYNTTWTTLATADIDGLQTALDAKQDDLGFGTAGQVLATNATTDGYEWVANGSGGDSSPLTTKGDLYTYDTGNARLPIGTNGTVLMADSAETTGIKWGDPADLSPYMVITGEQVQNGTLSSTVSVTDTSLPTVPHTKGGTGLTTIGTAGQVLKVNAGATGLEYGSAGGGSSPLTTKGDVYVYGSADARLPVGTNGQVLTADSAEALGVKWAAAGAGDVTQAGNNTYTGDNTYRNEVYMQTSGGTTYAMFDAANSRMAIGSATTPRYVLSVGDDIGNIAGGFTGKTLCLGSTTSGTLFTLGQDSTHGLQFLWDYNATAGNAYGTLNTWGYSNPIRIDASTLALQSQTAGRVAVGQTTADEKLHVNGNVKATGFIGSGASLTAVGVLASANTWTNTNTFRTLNLNNSSGTANSIWDSSTQRLGIGTTSPSHALVVGTDISTFSFTGTCGVFTNTSANSGVTVGQAAGRQMFFKWNYNATVGSAYGEISTYGYTNPIRFDASELEFQTTSNGDIKMGSSTSDIGFFGVTPVARPSAMTAADASAVNSGDATTDTVINNMRTRINEMETKLKALGLIA